MGEEQILKNIWQSISGIKGELALSDKQISEIMELSTHEYLTLKSLEKDLPANALFSLCEHFKINELNFITKDIDFNSLRTNYYGLGEAELPEKYSRHAHSRMFTIRHIYNFAKMLGKGDYLCNKLQVDKSLIEKDLDISCLAVSDALEAIRPFCSMDDIHRISAANAFKFSESSFGEELKKASSFKELYERWIGLEHIFEENWSYELQSLSEERVQIKCLPREELIDHFKTQSYSNLITNHLRAGFASLLPKYLGMPAAEYTMPKSVHFGDSHCIFDLYLPKAKQRFLKIVQ